MTLRGALVAVIALATIAFVVGTTIERNSAEPHGADKAGKTAHQEGERGEHARSETRPAGQRDEQHSELTPLGIDIEAAPFVALAALASLALAVAVWLRPRAIPLLVLVALAMLAFAALDLQEVVHQSDEARTGLAILAAVVAALHLAAAAVATLMIRAARAPSPPHRPLGASGRGWQSAR